MCSRAEINAVADAREARWESQSISLPNLEVLFPDDSSVDEGPARTQPEQSKAAWRSLLC